MKDLSILENVIEYEEEATGKKMNEVGLEVCKAIAKAFEDWFKLWLK